MLQQTQVATVIPYYERWLRRFPNVQALAHASESDVLHAWQGLGYYARARNLHASAKALSERYGGIFPRSSSELQALPGIGRYTANAILTFAFGQSLPIVEANTARLFARLLNLKTRVDSGEGRDQLWDFAAALLPRRDAALHNSAVMDLGALVCVAGQPNCGVCPVRTFCRAEAPALLPMKQARTPLKLLTEDHLFAATSRGVTLEQSQDRWRGMWILPRLASSSGQRRVLYSAEFPFTHHRITLRVCEVPPDANCSTDLQRTFAFGEVASIPMPSPHRRALDALIRASSRNAN